MHECVFCAIVSGEESAHRVYEDGATLAFLDHAPIAAGHTLVIPQRHVSTLSAAESTTVSAVFRTAQLVGRAVEPVLDVDGYNLIQSNGVAAGQEVDHLHVHVVPRTDGDDVTIDAVHGSLSQAAGRQVARQLRSALQ